jgi:hypothetical protein
MAMRYLVRRTKVDDLTDIKRDVPDLDEKLGKIGADIGTAGAHYFREIEVRITPLRHITYQFQPKKNGTTWTWICPSIELVAEHEEGLFALTDRVKAPRPSHLMST